jgi:predicted MarR family transcription regulator
MIMRLFSLIQTATMTRIVSSSHLVSSRSEELSEFEFGLIIANNAFSRWVVRCMAAAGLGDLNTIEVLLLHHVSHRGRNKKLADICFVLNIEDTHVVTYALKKLTQLGLVRGEKQGKEVFYSTTTKGQTAVEKYREVREQCLIEDLQFSEEKNRSVGEMAVLLRQLSGIYDQAARSASSL